MALEHYTEKILLTTKDSFCKAKLMAKEKLNMLMETNILANFLKTKNTEKVFYIKTKIFTKVAL